MSIFKQFTLALILCVSVLLSTLSNAATEPKEIRILLDVSGSNPLLTDKRFNEAAARYMDKALADIKPKDTVILQSFGSHGAADNLVEKTIIIKRHRETSARNFVKNKIRNLPKQVKAQGSTNIIGWFSRHRPDCSRGNRLLFITDGIEASEYMPKPDDLLNGKAQLPKPHEFINLKGCDITFYGLGAGRTDKQLNNLRRQWRAYFKAAGAHFTGIAK
jgi:predicted GNAT family acetyltransferase